jgi:FixJ family two-component response regulator
MKRIPIQDNGKGIPQEVIDKIMSGIPITKDKKGGTGLGFVQILDALQHSGGEISIDSEINNGTKVTLTLPKEKNAPWIAEQLEFKKGNIVVIIDDDDSIHNAWKIRFKDYMDIIHLKHFKNGKEAVDFINSTPKKELFVLVDFELINQELNGIEIIEQTDMQDRSIIVTSHYENQEVRKLSAKSGIKMLPKPLAAEIPIKIVEKKNVDVVIIDDDEVFTNCLTGFLKEKAMVVDTYHNPKVFLENLSQYDKKVKICMDNDFRSQISGFELAKRLNKAGYTRLYMLSGKTFKEEEIPNYLTVLLKGDMKDLNKLI